MIERIAGTDWMRGGAGIFKSVFSLAWEGDGEHIVVKSQSDRDPCCMTTVPIEALYALFAERPWTPAWRESAIVRLCSAAADAEVFKDEGGATLRELAPLALAEHADMKLWRQRALNAEEALRESAAERRAAASQHAPSPDYRLSEKP